MKYLLLAFNKYIASEVLSFSIHHFFFQYIISQSEHKFTSEHLKRNKQKVSAGKKTMEEEQTISLKSTQNLR